MSGTENAAARPGDLVVVQLRHSDQEDGRSWERDRFWLGQVTEVTRDGMVRAYRPAGRLAGETDRHGRLLPPGRALPGGSFERALVKSARQVDVEGALATAACHAWLGYEDQVRGYNSLREVRGALRPHLREQPRWERLRDAARTWEAARLAALQLLAGAGRAAGSARIGAYSAAVAAANAAYRQRYAENSGLWGEAA